MQNSFGMMRNDPLFPFGWQKKCEICSSDISFSTFFSQKTLRQEWNELDTIKINVVDSRENTYWFSKIFDSIIKLQDPIYFCEDENVTELTSETYINTLAVGIILLALAKEKIIFPMPSIIRRNDGLVDIYFEDSQKTVILRIGKWNTPVRVYQKKLDDSFVMDVVPLENLHNKLKNIFK